MLGPDMIPSYHFKFPPHQNVIDAFYGHNKLARKIKDQHKIRNEFQFKGMNPFLERQTAKSVAQDLRLEYERNTNDRLVFEKLEFQESFLKRMNIEKKKPIKFDSSFESANLDQVIQIAPREFDLYMRVDSNTRGHHQWFYFKLENFDNVGPVKFNIVNFTKR